MLTCKRAKFTLSQQTTYLNCAYMSPMMKSVEKAGIRGLRRKRNPIHISASDFFNTTDELRNEYSRLIHAGDPQRIVIIPSVSYGIANVVRNLQISSGHNIVVASEQFPSNYYPWQQLCAEKKVNLKVVSPPDDFRDRGKIWNEKILDAIDQNTRLVAIANVHWTDGTRFDLMAIRRRTLDTGALLVVDGTQSVGAMPFDVGTIQPDALICAGYKWLLGPYSIGLAYYGPYFDNGKAVEENWINRLNSEDFTGLVNYQEQYQPGALRYEVGEHSNFILVPMMLSAVQQLNRWGIQNIQEYCHHISSQAIAKLLEEGFFIEEQGHRGAHLFGIRLPKNISIEKVKLSLQQKKVSVSVRGDAIRVSPNVYNNEEDLQRLVKILTS